MLYLRGIIRYLKVFMRLRNIGIQALEWLSDPRKEKPGPGAWTRKWKVNGIERWYEVALPSQPDCGKSSPLILAFHGAMSKPATFAYVTQLSRRAGELGYVVAYPAAHGGFWSPNSGSGSDDLAFVEAVVRDLESIWSIDPTRIFATGISNGGQMVYRLACALSTRIAAIAVSACGMGLADCRPERPVPVMHFHGTADTFVSITWADDAIRRWRNFNNCETEPTITYQNGDAICRTYKAREGGADVAYCVVNGMGHQWCGMAIRLSAGETRLLGLPELLSELGPGTDDADATGMLLSFFEDHPRMVE
jgi:polyhydroxybutyrate depolymerase